MTLQPKWIDIGAIGDIPVRGSRVVKAGNRCVAIFRTAENEAFALDDKCPHKGGPLSQGIVHGRSVTCPLHNWVIDLATGKAQGADTGQTLSIGIEIKDGRLLLDAGALAGRRAA
jgi:nitrite reductase (NADH) small subunit